ncbi:MAG: hypothetical protein ACO3JH_04670 [Flavobacteriaceae bacterium]
MANRLFTAVKNLNFRYVPAIETLSDVALNATGYYRGFVCPHNHNIRDAEKHWCYFCIKKIFSNVCAFDINYINFEYKQKLYKLWHQIEVNDINDCWFLTSNVYRVCLPSYRSHYCKQKAELVTTTKAIYQACWGDIGSCFVTRLCKNKKCHNPLHLISSWNQSFPPSRMSSFDLNFSPEKLMLYGQQKEKNLLLESSFLPAIGLKEEQK